ncbi:winged helix-turn-helix transcriptional regulator [Verrucomicrobiaceae bacterium N1E253]|uniref:Winged helix-turn-helix transcriptional regulator n=1 Tax=Oceaniferula marina TaxID=2748318 RepID=A0A851GAV2_9BACT|nr:metalloregulator ArsR/SmtB family transcription factor [Oceaniferula marina]NWK54743.1 winged helix-turn-helix transcriptional regulator [Oceaniferula marina]
MDATQAHPIPCRKSIERQAETLKALAHPARLAIVHALASGPVCACDLAEHAESSPPTTSRHLTVLRHAGIISQERRGQQIFYELKRPCVLTFIECCND